MITAALFASFIVLAGAGVPIGAALALAGMAAIAASNPGAPWWGLLAAPQNAQASIAKYPLLALPMFVLVGVVFDRAGVAARLVDLARACAGYAPGTLPALAVAVAVVLGGISGSGPAAAAAVGGVMIAAMLRAGYPPPYTAGVIGAAAATDILIPPSIALVVYSVAVPGASVPALFAAGLVPGLLAALALAVCAVAVARRRGFGAREAELPRPPFWRSLRGAAWGLAAPVLILGGMRAGWFTPTEAAVVAAAYGLLIGFAVYRTLSWRDLLPILRDATETSTLVMTVIALAGVFAFAVNTLGVADPLVRAVQDAGLGSTGALLALLALLLAAGLVLDGVSIFMIFLPLAYPLMLAFGWDVVWVGVLITMMVAIGQFTPPVAVNLLVACRLAGARVEHTLPVVAWLVVAFALAVLAVAAWPSLALALPRALGY